MGCLSASRPQTHPSPGILAGVHCSWGPAQLADPAVRASQGLAALTLGSAMVYIVFVYSSSGRLPIHCRPCGLNILHRQALGSESRLPFAGAFMPSVLQRPIQVRSATAPGATDPPPSGITQTCRAPSTYADLLSCWMERRRMTSTACARPAVAPQRPACQAELPEPDGSRHEHLLRPDQLLQDALACRRQHSVVGFARRARDSVLPRPISLPTPVLFTLCLAEWRVMWIL